MNRTHLAPVAMLCLLGCRSTVPVDPADPAVPHVHRITTTVSISDAAVLPHVDEIIPVLSTVVWRNQGQAPLRIDVQAVSCGKCETVLGFRTAAHGAQSVAIAPGAVATLCFHELGVFPYTAQIGGVTHRGTISVVEDR